MGDAASPATVTFTLDRNAPGRDPVHWANGSGTIITTAQGAVLRLNGDFEAGPGPNFWVYLNTRAVGDEAEFNADAGRVKIAPLKSFKGSQNFMLPEGLDPAQFHTVTIWCESFWRLYRQRRAEKILNREHRNATLLGADACRLDHARPLIVFSFDVGREFRHARTGGMQPTHQILMRAIQAARGCARVRC